MNYEIGSKVKKGGYNLYSREIDVKLLSIKKMDSESYDKNFLLKKEIEYLQSLSGEELLRQKNVMLDQVGFLPKNDIDHKKLFMFRTVNDASGKEWVILKDVFEFNVGFPNFRNLTGRMKKKYKGKVEVGHFGIERSLSALRPQHVLTMLNMPSNISFKGVIQMILSIIIADDPFKDTPLEDESLSISSNKMEVDEPCEENKSDEESESETDVDEIDPSDYKIMLIPDKIGKLIQLLAKDTYLSKTLGPFIEYKK